MASCPHIGSRTDHTSSGWDTSINPATGRQENWRQWHLGWTTCDDCGATVATRGPRYEPPRW